jgi:cytosine/adenosine deaminase-related metal-dependent hydrolase
MTTYAARWVLPITAPPIDNGAVVEEGGRIVYVGPRTAAPRTGDEVDLGNAILLPGLVNAHTHLELTAMRGFLEGLEFWPWIQRLIAARRDVLDGDALLDSARLGIAEGLRAGMTTYADTGASAAPFHAMRELGVRGIAYQEVFGPDPAQAEGAFAELCSRLAVLTPDETSLVRLGVSPHAPYSVSDALFAATGQLARREGRPIAVHIAESDAEFRLVSDGTGDFAEFLRGRGIAVAPRGESPVQLLELTGVLASRPLLIHCVRVDTRDITRIASHDCGVAHCPASNAKLGHGIAPLLALREAGIRVGLGTDSVASNNRMDLLDEARIAILLQSGHHGRRDALDAVSALELATIGSARAIEMDREIGSLETGKAADLAAFSLDGARGAPSFSPESALVHAMAGTPASLVTVGGRALVRGGQLAFDDAPIAQRVSRIGAALAAWQAAGGSSVARPA